jgi:hypothetical protein
MSSYAEGLTDQFDRPIQLDGFSVIIPTREVAHPFSQFCQMIGRHRYPSSRARNVSYDDNPGCAKWVSGVIVHAAEVSSLPETNLGVTFEERRLLCDWFSFDFHWGFWT